MDWAKKNISEVYKPTDTWKSELTITATLTGLNGSYSVTIVTVADKADIEWTRPKQNGGRGRDKTDEHIVTVGG